MSADLRRFHAAVERVRLRAMVAVESGTAQPRGAALAQAGALLEAMEQELAGTAAGARDLRLAAALGLGADEVDFLWTAVAATVDPRILPHAQVLFGGEARRGASLALHALIAQLDGERSVALGLALGPANPLVRLRILVPADDLSGAGRAWVVAHRVAAFLAGDDAIDPEVAAAGGVVEVPADLRFDDAGEAVRRRLAGALAQTTPLVIQLDGPWAVGKRTAIAAAAAEAGRPVVALDVARLPPTPQAVEHGLAALLRECILRGAVPLIASVDDLIAGESEVSARMRTLARAIDGAAGVIACTAGVAGVDLGVSRPQLRVSLPVPDTATRRQLWDRALAGGPRPPDDDLDLLSMRYRLGAGAIERAVAAARLIAAARGAAAPTGADLVGGVRNNIAERLGGLAQRVEVKQGWDELVLATDTLDQVKALAARVRHGHRVLEQWGFHRKLARGTGVAALFSGPPGTGKTMVAGLIARELDLELYQVDLSKVVSKWVGETERQLAKIFEAADAGHALLLFDEADSLFAKRTEVKAAIDRYANLEVNYLLQRIESFGGITVLTTNMDTAIDPAMRRRLAAHIIFWPPELDERVALWKSMFPASAPLAGDVDFDELAHRYPEMTGANIRNAAIAGAFLASSEGDSIAQRHLERAARGEYRSMGRVLSGAS
jgi:hypothetical protein